MTKKLAIFNSENIEIIDAIKIYFKDKDIEVSIVDTCSDEYDLIALTGFEYCSNFNYDCKILNIHPSLLPAFKGSDSIKEAFLAGVKVSGVSIHEVSAENFYGRILAQYPVLIGNTTHIDELIGELKAICIKLYPIVIDAVLNDKVFDFSDLFKSSCLGGCASCSKCH